MEPRQLSEELRNGSNPDLNRRRWIIGLSILGSTVAQIVSLYQTGIIKKLPDPPIPIFDSDKVDASNYAYKRLNQPDGPGMIASYAVTTMLASAGGKDRAHQSPFLPIAMGAKILGDSAVALKLAQEEWAENKKLCAYCQVATLASLASIALAAPEVISAVRNLLGKKEQSQLAY
jgi:uncharacterized membrane protein